MLYTVKTMSREESLVNSVKMEILIYRFGGKGYIPALF